MLQNGSYPYYLKKRISGDTGHLSNRQALQLFVKHRPRSMSHLFLAHLSANNNCPNLVQQLFQKHAKGVEMIVASRFAETPVYYICNAAKFSNRRTSTVSAAQLAFAFN
jgi:hypothetical protein